MKTTFLRATARMFASLLLTVEVAAFTADRPSRPNIVFILMDDLGWADLGCNGSEFYETPNIDRLASQGMRFTDAYAACNCCSPTRASVLTGKYPARLRLTDWIPGSSFPRAKLRPPDWKQELPFEEVTLAEALKPADYVTAAVGKWHLGKEPFLPQNQGFDINIAGNHSGAPGSYFWPYGHGDPAKTNRYHGGAVPDVFAGGKEGEYLTDRLTDEALAFIEANRDRPFLLYFAHYAVHTPLQAKPELIAKYRAKLRPGLKQNNPTYAAMVESMDQSVGRLMEKLEALGITEKTVIFFTSDNGGYSGYGGKPGGTWNAPVRDGKGSSREGGHRVPLIIRWPGGTQAGSVCREPVISPDFYPTILEMTGTPGDQQHNAKVDGVSLVPLLKQTGKPARDAIYWHYPHYNVFPEKPYGAVRQGDFKLIEFYEDNRVELYNLKNDLSEKTNLAGQMPDLVATLRGKLAAWRKSVGAQMPLPNPADTNPSAQDITFTASCDGTEQRYVQMLPADYRPGQPCDLLIALHGHGSDRWQFVRDKRDECRAARDVAAAHGMLYVSPDYRAKTSWMGPKAEADVVQIIAELKRKHRIRRVFICGGSMGGTSSLTFAALHPDLMDGVAAMNGTANHVEYANFQDAIAASFGGAKADVPEEYRKRSAELNSQRLTMPVGLTTGGKDTVVPPQSVLRLADALRKQGRRVLLIHRETTGHSTNYDDSKAILEFVIQEARKKP
jgi:arylsulfatase A-like enzyme/predicted esterase